MNADQPLPFRKVAATFAQVFEEVVSGGEVFDRNPQEVQARRQYVAVGVDKPGQDPLPFQANPLDPFGRLDVGPSFNHLPFADP